MVSPAGEAFSARPAATVNNSLKRDCYIYATKLSGSERLAGDTLDGACAKAKLANAMTAATIIHAAFMRAKRSFLAKVPVQQGSISCGAAHRRRSPTIPYLWCTASALSDGFAQHVVIADMVGEDKHELGVELGGVRFRQPPPHFDQRPIGRLRFGVVASGIDIIDTHCSE